MASTDDRNKSADYVPEEDSTEMEVGRWVGANASILVFVMLRRPPLHAGGQCHSRRRG